MKSRGLGDVYKRQVSALYEALQTRFGLGVDDPKHGFSEAALAAVMAAFDTHPEAGK